MEKIKQNSPMSNFSIVSDEKSILGESPIWDELSQKIYWVDIEGKTLHAWSYLDNKKLSWNFVSRPCAISLTNKVNILLCAFDKYFAYFNIENQKIEKLKNQIELPNNVRFNDGKTDGYGRFWCGTMSEAVPIVNEAGIYMLDQNFTLKNVFKNIYISNSLTTIKGNNGIYFSDSYTKTIYKAIFSKNSNEVLQDIKVFRDNHNFKGAPDGSTTDIEGNLWNAEWNGSRIVKYDSNSNILEEITVPLKRPTSCTFGGPNMDLLFITSAITDNNKDNSLNGNVIYFKTNTKGVFSNRFILDNLN